MRRFALAVAFLVLPFSVQAQVRGRGPAGGGHAMISAPRTSAYAAPVGRPAGSGGVVYRSSQPRTAGAVTTGRRTFTTRTAPRGATTASAFGPASALPDFTNAVPGLGFDYVHYAAVHPNRGRRGFSSANRGFFPFFDAGFLLPYAGGYGYDEPQGYEPQPQQQAADVPGGEDVNAERRQAYASQPVSSYDVVVEPQKPSEQYVFVRRDGSVFFAVAYSWEAGNLYYVTQEGLRRSVTRDSLDLDATQQFNEQRGLSFLSPARS